MPYDNIKLKLLSRAKHINLLVGDTEHIKITYNAAEAAKNRERAEQERVEAIRNEYAAEQAAKAEYKRAREQAELELRYKKAQEEREREESTRAARRAIMEEQAKPHPPRKVLTYRKWYEFWRPHFYEVTEYWYSSYGGGSYSVKPPKDKYSKFLSRRW